MSGPGAKPRAGAAAGGRAGAGGAAARRGARARQSARGAGRRPDARGGFRAAALAAGRAGGCPGAGRRAGGPHRRRAEPVRGHVAAPRARRASGARPGRPDGARRELEAVLRKQPEHPRALEALSELLWDRQEWAEAGEIYLRRAVVERDAATRCRIFLRLGRDLFDAGARPEARRRGVRARAGRRRAEPGSASCALRPVRARGGDQARASRDGAPGRLRARPGPAPSDARSPGRGADAGRRSVARRRRAATRVRRGAARRRGGRGAGPAARPRARSSRSARGARSRAGSAAA